MMISELPPEYQELALLRKKEYEERNGIKAATDNLSSAFVWPDTPEKEHFWAQVAIAETPDRLPPIPQPQEDA